MEGGAFQLQISQGVLAEHIVLVEDLAVQLVAVKLWHHVEQAADHQPAVFVDVYVFHGDQVPLDAVSGVVRFPCCIGSLSFRGMRKQGSQFEGRGREREEGLVYIALRFSNCKVFSRGVSIRRSKIILCYNNNIWY